MLNRDPTRTTTLRLKFMRDLKRRHAALKKQIFELIVTEDAFGMDASRPTGNTRFEFQTNPRKVRTFNRWLKAAIEAGQITLDETGTYIESAYKKGVIRSYILSRDHVPTPEKQAFLASAFGGSVGLEQVEMLATRAFEDLKGVSSTMATQMNRIFTEAIAHGHGPRETARDLFHTVDKLTRTRSLTIARTEIVRSYAEGQLDSFDQLGVQELNVDVEWSTAGDDRVCPLCLPMEGRVFTVEEARGEIPLHPNCRCAWVPYFPTPRKRRRR